MSKFIDLTGQKHHMLLVLELAGKKHGHLNWKCLCDCGNITYTLGCDLTSGRKKSCGCLSRYMRIQNNTTHGMSKTRLYTIWNGIKKRCYNPNFENYKHYGGRGIEVCNEWKNDFEVFASWAMDNGYTDELTIERIDVNKNYCPENCKWITKTEQAKNKRTSRYFTYDGKTQILKDWCREVGLPYKAVHRRIFERGWSFEKTISQPIRISKNIRKGDCNG